MKILYITNFYTFRDSSAAVRNNALVKGLTELGHSVDVHTVRFSEEKTSPDLNYGNITFTDVFDWTARQSLGNKVDKSRLLTFARNVYVSLRKYREFPDKYYGWIKKFNVAAIDADKYDLMISSSDGKTSHYVAERIKRKKPSLKWIQIWGDPWYDDVNLKGFLRWRVKNAERKILTKADKIVYISAPTAEVMQARYQKLAGNIHFVPRSYMYEYKYDVPTEGDMHVVYAGSISAAHGRNINGFVEAISNYNTTADRKIILDVYGVVDEAIKQEVSSRYANFYDGVNVKQLGEVYKKSNALLYISNKAGSTQIPGKLYDYLGTSSTILCLVNNKTDGIAEFLRTLGERCLLVENNKSNITEELPEIVSKIKCSFAPSIDFSPRNVATQVLNLVK